ncbi:hypothetical protein [Porphyromonas loveana]|uniref:hypothetical protein n=2 Tax=Porphyromonas loveana TaxID=1884669 RepID=UPI0035A04713
MVTSVIGKIFLQAYNEKNGTAYAPKDFFMEIYYPLFFKGEKYLMTAGNSPFENPKLSWKDMILGKKPFETAERREERLRKFINKIDTGLADASIAVGYPSIDTLSTTSGQISIPQEQIDPAESYLSWIGAGLGVGVEGGLTILFDKPELLLDIFEGWKVYRGLLNTTPNMRGNQINTWNAQWLRKKYDTVDTSESNNTALLTKDGLAGIDTLPWGELLVAISRHFSDPKMMGYVYNIGQTNTTVGFIPFALSPIRKAHQLYVRYFGADKCEKAMLLFGTALGFSMACRGGVIGMRALEPKGLTAIMKSGKIPSYKPDNEDQKIQFQTYQIWLLAMLSNEELWNKAEAFANTLQAYTVGGKSGRTGRSNAVKQLLEATNKKLFIERMSGIVENAEETCELVEIASIINVMPADNVPYFLTLIRFHYAVINRQETIN